jgi:low affinity Fe/Cu permease
VMSRLKNACISQKSLIVILATLVLVLLMTVFLQFNTVHNVIQSHQVIFYKIVDINTLKNKILKISVIMSNHVVVSASL